MIKCKNESQEARRSGSSAWIAAAVIALRSAGVLVQAALCGGIGWAKKRKPYCENLRDIHITPFIREIGEDAFYNISNDAVFHVIKGTYAERYCQEHEFDYDYKLDPDLLKKVQAIVNARKQQMEKKRHEEEMRAEQERQRILSARRARYAEIEQAIALQMQIINQNKGWFGAQAQARKAAQEQLANLQAQLAKEFPGGKP